jgi:hypothetical protein
MAEDPCDDNTSGRERESQSKCESECVSTLLNDCSATRCRRVCTRVYVNTPLTQASSLFPIFSNLSKMIYLSTVISGRSICALLRRSCSAHAEEADVANNPLSRATTCSTELARLCLAGLFVLDTALAEKPNRTGFS